MRSCPPSTACGRPVRLDPPGPQIALGEEDVDCKACLWVLAEPWHGTLGGYRNHTCRCGPCNAANTAWQKAWRERMRAEGREPAVHGAGGYTNYGCRCTDCRAGHRLYQAAKRAEASGQTAGEKGTP